MSCLILAAMKTEPEESGGCRIPWQQAQDGVQSMSLLFHSPVQCCLTWMQQGSTVKKLKAQRCSNCCGSGGVWAKKSRATRENNTGEDIQPLHPLSLPSSSPSGSQSCSQKETHPSGRQQPTGDVSGREEGKRTPKYLVKGTHPRYGADVVGDGD